MTKAEFVAELKVLLNSSEREKARELCQRLGPQFTQRELQNVCWAVCRGRRARWMGFIDKSFDGITTSDGHLWYA